MSLPRVRERTVALLAGLLVVALASGAFALGRSLGTDRGSAAAQGDEPIQGSTPPPEITPIAPPPGTPGQRPLPDTTDPLWYLGYLEWAARQPRFRQVLNGIEIDPERIERLCDAQVEPASADAAAGTDIDIRPHYLPEGAVRDDFVEVGTCRGVPVFMEVHYRIPEAPDFLERLKAGESFFDLPHGGLITIQRYRTSSPAARVDLASSLARGVTVGGHPAVLIDPVFPEGLGEGAVVAWDEQQQIVTKVLATDLPSEEILRVAEGLVR